MASAIIAQAHQKVEEAKEEAEREKERRSQRETQQADQKQIVNDFVDEIVDEIVMLSEEEKKQQIDMKASQRKIKMLEALVPNPILPKQFAVLDFYHDPPMQIGVAVLIFLNFFISAAYAQIGPQNCVDTCDTVFSGFEWIFNILFLIELIVNIYAHWLVPFWKSGWNIFDVFIVGVSWVSMLFDAPGIAVLRLFRAFRAFRLFKRIQEVKKIIVSVTRSLPGVSNAFLLLLIIMGIWAIMGVSFFRHDFPDFFGTFSLAMLTLFQVMTFDSWVSQITRPVCLYYNSWGAPLYFLSYIVIAGIIMTNVVVAILLERFMAASAEMEAAALKDLDEDGDDLSEEEEEEIPYDPIDHSKMFWGDLQLNLITRLNKIDSICHKPTPEVLEAERKAREEAAEQAARDVEERKRKDTLPGQTWLKDVYDSPPPQLIVAGAIVLNFFVSAAKAQIVPDKDDPAMDVFRAFEWCFNLLFGVELVANMYANGLPFWKDNWNKFDFLIVVISWASMLELLQGGISVLRLFRAFRVFRLFKRVKALRMIIAGIIFSLPGVFNAFVILFLVMGIWSIMGCNFFGEKFDPEFGNFAKAMLSMFQIMSYDSWSSGITRPVVVEFSPNPIPPLFFLSYVFVSAIIMSNVVLAILLDKFLASSKEFDKEEAAAEEAEALGESMTIGQARLSMVPVEAPMVPSEAAASDKPKEKPKLKQIPEIMDDFGPSMHITKDHVLEFERRVCAKLEAIDKFVQGPLKALIEAQKDQTMGLEAKKPSLQQVSQGFFSKLGIGGGNNKTSQVRPA